MTATLALRAKQSVSEEGKVGVQIGEPIGESRPPRVYIFFDEYSNSEITSAVVHMMESGGISEAYEFPNPSTYQENEGSEAKAAGMIQGYLEGFSEEDDVTRLLFAGNQEIANELIERLDIPEYIEISINEAQSQYIP